MSRANEPAAPAAWWNTGDLNASAPNGEVVPPGASVMMHGLTIREHFAGLAMQGLLAKAGADRRENYGEAIAVCATSFADALLAELAKPVKS